MIYFCYNLIKFFFKKNQNRFKPTGFSSVRLFRTKTGSNWFGSVISGLARFFSGFGSVRFFCFTLIKPNRTSRFFKILIGFFSRFGFYDLIGFSVFNGLIYNTQIFSYVLWSIHSILWVNILFEAKKRLDSSCHLAWPKACISVTGLKILMSFFHPLMKLKI
jgi:hypothetical protein